VGLTTGNPLTLGRAWDLIDPLISSIAHVCPGLGTLEPAGEVRRVEPLVGSIVLAGCADDPDAALAGISSLFAPRDIVERHPDRIAVAHRQASVEIWIVAPEEYGTLLFRTTGSEAHVRQIEAYGLARETFATETLLYSSVGLPLIPAELRAGDGEVEAARAGRLPAVVALEDMRGDLHMHTDFSDGRDSLLTMVEGCEALGYEYIAITDHSMGANAARTLAIEDIPRQRDLIQELRELCPRIAILHGVEVDIRPDGRLDFADAILEPFDIVLASLHVHAGHDAARLTGRSLAAIRHPFVNVLCHPANQLPGRYRGYPLDFDALYEAAAETGTALEIDGAPSHMDLDGARARAAAAAGATLTVDSDCHRVEALGRQMRIGVGIARRGWVEARHVLNTRSVDAVRAFIAAKRQSN
jgi:DNA polymerase (family X)